MKRARSRATRPTGQRLFGPPACSSAMVPAVAHVQKLIAAADGNGNHVLATAIALGPGHTGASYRSAGSGRGAEASGWVMRLTCDTIKA